MERIRKENEEWRKENKMKTWLKLTRTNAPLSCSGWYKFPDPYIVAEKKFNVKGVLCGKRIFFHRVYTYIYLSFSFFGFVQRLLVSSPCLSVKSCWVWKYRYSNQCCVHRTCWSTFSLRKDLGFFLRFEQRWFKIEEREEKEREREKKEIESRVFTTRTRDIISRASFKRCSVHSKRVEEIRAAYHIESIVIIYKASSTGCVQRLAVFPIRIISTF